MEILDKEEEEGKAPSDKVKGAKEKACGGKCVSPTICKDVFQGECAVEIMSEQMGKNRKVGTSDSAPKGKY